MKPPRSSPSPAPGAPADVVELSRFRADLGRGRRLRRGESLLSAADPEQAIRALPGDEFYYVLHELGFPDGMDILQHGTAEQVQAALDFALWDRDQLAPAAITEWIGALTDASIETLGEWVTGLDIELFALLLRRRTRVYDLSLEEPPDEPEGTFYPTPDNLFVLDLLGDDEERRVSHQLVDSLYRYDQNWIRKVVVGTRGEMDSELEEEAYRWRSGRMADLGFEDYHTALEVYRELDPASVRLGSEPAPRVRPLVDGDPEPFLRVPSGLAERLSGGAPFARAVAGLSSREELDNLHAALVILSNRVLAADRANPGDDEAVSAVLARMAGTLDLAVEFLARGRTEDAVRAVRTVPLLRLFQLGVSLIGKVRKLGLTLKRGTPFARLGVDLFEPGEDQILEAVTRLRPLFPRLLDEPPAAGERPFDSLADIAKALAAVERAGAALTLIYALGIRPEPLASPQVAELGVADPAELDAALLARTVLARHWLAQAPSALRPLDGGEAAQLEQKLRDVAKDADLKIQTRLTMKAEVARLWPGGTLPAAAEAVAVRWIDDLLAGAAVLRI